MSVTWTKFLLDQRHTRGLPPQGSSVEYTWRCRAVTTATGVELAWDPFSYATNVTENLSIPRPGQTVGEIFTTIGGWADYFRFRSVQWSKVPESVSMWDATAVATSRDVFCPEPNVIRQDSVTVRKANVYRAVDPDPAVDLGGGPVDDTNHIDIAGKPESRDVGQVQVSITFLWNTADTQPETPGYPDPTRIIPYMNCVNEEPFLGFPAFSVVLLGANIDPEEHEYVRVTYQFLFDAWYHLEQQPKTSSQGQPLTKIENGVRRAAEVDWVQPYPVTADFNDAFSEYEQAWLTQGWSYWASANCPGEEQSLTGEGAILPVSSQLGTNVRPEPEEEEEEEEEEGEGEGEGGEE